jgi:hypothetical protein
MASARGMRERRDTTPAGQKHRARFEASVGILRSLGLSPQTIEYLRRHARVTRRLPHELVVDVVEGTIHRLAVIEAAKNLSRGV